MRRGLIPAALSIAAVSAVALTVPGVGYAAPAAHGRAAKTVTAEVSDLAADVVVKSGTVSDLNPNASGVDPFRPGKGTAVPSTEADRAMDLRRVTYRVRRTGAHPSLRISYTVAGPFAHSENIAKTGNSVTDTESVDGVEVILAKGYTLETMNDGIGGDNGLMDKHGKKIRCKGLRSTMKSGAHVANQTVPLSCLAGVGLRRSRLQAMTMHGTVTVTGDVAGPPESSAVEPIITIATDGARPTRRLNLTPAAR